LDIKQQIHFGRRIVEGEKKVKIFGEEIAVNAEVVYIDGYSGHADQKLLMNFVGEFKEKPKKIFLVHGEEEAQNVLKGKIEEEYGIDTEIPSFGDSFRVDEIVEKEENLLEKEKVVATREEKIEFANKVADLNEEISMLSDTIADRMTHVHVKSEELTTNTDKTILEQVLSKLNKLELAIQLMLNQAEKNCNDKEGTEQKEKEEKQEKKSSKSKNKKKDEEIDDIDDII
jgi:RNA-metabolizing metallo-beta-lactamase